MNSFLGLCGYYAHFIDGYAEIARPLRNAALSPGKLVWTAEMRQAFAQLKSILASPPVLSLPRFRGMFVLYTDACNTTVGSVLTERIDGEERVIAYDSKVLTKQQVKWPTYDKELWAVVHAIRRFRQYTTGAKFLVVTDHKPLANIPQSIAVERDGTGRRGRWAIELSSFEFDVEIKAGVEHRNADALSRRPAESGTVEVPTPEVAVASVSGAKASVAASRFLEDKPRSGGTFSGVCPDPDRAGGVETQVMSRALKGSPVPGGTDTGVCPDPDHTVQAQVTGDAQGIRQAQEQDYALQQIRSRLESGETPDRSKMGAWGKVLLPRWRDVELRDGVIGLATDRLHSDQGRQFESRVFQAMCQRLGIHKTRTTPYHPESDGMVERFNRTLKDMISKYVDAEGLHWDVDIKAYSMAYNSSIHSATGYTPFYLVHGYEPRMPLDVEYGPAVESVPVHSYLEDRLRSMRAAYNQVRSNSARAAKEAAERYDAKQCAEEYRIGDKVWTRDFRAAAGGKPKLGLPFTGPSTIIGKVGAPGKEVAYKVANKDGKVSA
ncbi:uncharacterized protein LOC122381712 [Amphibalanus amphitrite]|uniref:uncharacterized protein LOC122381712 n=1 Tax=Amphibalanus amphitrite TaxID=1232801 RepID=UPI001C9082BB|nr:uncharacterized protein LOC122381712 [Amphibalanus amphitrite]